MASQKVPDAGVVEHCAIREDVWGICIYSYLPRIPPHFLSWKNRGINILSSSNTLSGLNCRDLTVWTVIELESYLG